MNIQTPTQLLFAALKPEDGTGASAINEATQAAEQRWPLLQSIGPQKWTIAPSLSAEEKSKRNQLEPSQEAIRRPASSAPNMNAELANALNRMVAQNPTLRAPVETSQSLAPTVAPVSKTVSQVSPPIEQVTTAISASPLSQEQSMTNRDSIISVLKRIEQASLPAPAFSEKMPGFLSRLGKR